MKLGYFAFPIHPKNKNYYSCLREDQDAIILCDKLGFHEAFIGEHLTDEYERITSSQIFLSSLINLTKNIKLATGTINLPNTHPVKVASNISMLDHMSKGRIIMGIGPGSLVSDMEIMGNLKKKRNEMFLEAIKHVLDLWSKKPPYNLRGKYWNINTKKTYDKKLSIGSVVKPFQKPRPEIVLTSLSNNPHPIKALTSRGWNLLSSNFLNENVLKTHFLSIQSIKRKKINWRVARKIFVNYDKKVVNKYVFSSKSPYYKVVSQILNKLKKYNRLDVVKKNPLDKKEKIDIEALMKKLIICGDPSTVSERILELKEKSGNFDTITYVGIDWMNKKLGIKSLELMANKVMPKLND